MVSIHLSELCEYWLCDSGFTRGSLMVKSSLGASCWPHRSPVFRHSQLLLFVRSDSFIGHGHVLLRCCQCCWLCAETLGCSHTCVWGSDQWWYISNFMVCCELSALLTFIMVVAMAVRLVSCETRVRYLLWPQPQLRQCFSLRALVMLHLKLVFSSWPQSFFFQSKI